MKLRTILLCSLLLALGSCKRTVLAKPKTIDAVLDRHEASLGSLATSDFVLTARVRRKGRDEKLRISVRRKPFAYREDWQLPSGGASFLSDGRHAWGAGPARRGLGAGLGTLMQRFGLLPAPMSRAVLERAFVLGKQYLDRELWRGHSGVDKTLRLEPFPQQSKGFTSGQIVHRVHVIASSAARLQFWFGAEDGKLLAVTEPEVELRWLRFGDFQNSGGSSFPRRRQRGFFDRKGGSTWQMEAPILVKQHKPGIFPFPNEGKPPWRKGPTFQTRVLSSPWHRALVVDELSLNGHSIKEALLDTGAATPAVLMSVAKDLRLVLTRRQKATTISGVFENPLFWLDELRGVGMRAVQTTVFATDLGKFPWRSPDRPMELLLGGEALFSDSPVLDFALGRLWLRNQYVVRLADKAGVGEVVELPLRGTGPAYVKLQVGNKEIEALVDSGWSGLFLFTSTAAAELGLPTTREALFARGGRAFLVGGVSGTITTQWDVTIPEVRLGAIRFERPRVSIEDLADRSRKKRYEAIIGCAALARFRKIGFDFARKKLEIEPGFPRTAGGFFQVPAPPSDPGLILGKAPQREGDSAPPLVLAVVQDSPAQKAGIRAGDRLVLLAGKPCRSASLDQLCLRLEKGVRTLSFVLRRNGKSIRGHFD